jgi:hypothetical protein
MWQAAEGKDTHWQAELARWAQSNAPGGNLWWLKPAIDHGFMNAMNESMSPGYLSRMEQRAFKDWGNRYLVEAERSYRAALPNWSTPCDQSTPRPRLRSLLLAAGGVGARRPRRKK